MKKGIIVTPYLIGKIKDLVDISKYEFIACADSAYILCKNENIIPNIIIGDFDHDKTTEPTELDDKIIRVSPTKDDTDTMLCLKYLLQNDYSDITILGGLGGRCDHTYANIQTLAYAHQYRCKLRIVDNNNELFMYGKGKYLIDTNKKYISLFSYSENSIISIKNAKYSGEYIKLNYYFPLGVSNEAMDKSVEIIIHEGLILVICSND